MMVDPGFAEDLSTESSVPFPAAPVVLRVASLGQIEGMRGCPQPDNRAPRLDVVHHMFHLLIGEATKASEDDHQVGIVECFEAGDIVVPVRIDFSRVRIDGKQDSAVEAMVLGEDFSELWESFLGPIFFITADQHDPLPDSGSLGPFMDDPLGFVRSDSTRDNKAGLKAGQTDGKG
jgi:hypothetical protein